mmetsp:Transcript_9427/g.14437  ORF Transcript_9427/g.14437 Transcript_9427/m.14437 type:complete len:92 (+) Transcript_9427:2207-2482(+)
MEVSKIQKRASSTGEQIATQSAKKTQMDIDNLQGVCVYIVYKMKYSGIVSDYFLINDFISKNVELSSRSIFLNVLKGGVDYLLEQAEIFKS